MKKSIIRWDQAYKQGTHWEVGPSRSVKEFVNYLKKGTKVLDLGCGSGRDSIYLAKKGYEVVGLDVSAEAIKKARSKASSSYSNLHFIEGKAEKLPFEVESFDAVYSTWTLQFCPLAEPASEIYRVIKKDGVAYLAFILATKHEGKTSKRIEKEEVLQTYKKFKLIASQEFEIEDHHEKGRPHWHENLVLILKK
jgi:ubiquinone/menaquinone biosynthesis C-methylase UbiE